jgi:hypothetical protein
MYQKAWNFDNTATRTSNFVTLLNTADADHHLHHIIPNTAATVSCANPDCSLPWTLQSLQANADTIQQNLNIWGVNLPQSLTLKPFFDLPCLVLTNQDVTMWPVCWCHHCCATAQTTLSSVTVLSCPVTPLHMYCFLLLCCNWPLFLHLRLPSNLTTTTQHHQPFL